MINGDWKLEPNVCFQPKPLLLAAWERKVGNTLRQQGPGDRTPTRARTVCWKLLGFISRCYEGSWLTLTYKKREEANHMGKNLCISPCGVFISMLISYANTETPRDFQSKSLTLLPIGTWVTSVVHDQPPPQPQMLTCVVWNWLLPHLSFLFHCTQLE